MLYITSIVKVVDMSNGDFDHVVEIWSKSMNEVITCCFVDHDQKYISA